jgi:hypothetical protein
MSESKGIPVVDVSISELQASPEAEAQGVKKGTIPADFRFSKPSELPPEFLQAFLQTTAYHICAAAQKDHERYVQKMREQRRQESGS